MLQKINSNLDSLSMDDINRHVKVYDSRTKKVLWDYIGLVYVTDNSIAGNFTLVYKDENGKIKKNYFLGENISLIMFD